MIGVWIIMIVGLIIFLYMLGKISPYEGRKTDIPYYLNTKELRKLDKFDEEMWSEVTRIKVRDYMRSKRESSN